MIAQQREAAASGVNTSPVMGVMTRGDMQGKGQKTGKGSSEGTILMSDNERQQLQQQMQQVCFVYCFENLNKDSISSKKKNIKSRPRNFLTY